MDIKEKIRQGRTCLGIELGSTRIKASLIDDSFTPIASGSYSWENRFEDGFWTYSLEDIHKGVRGCYADLAKNVRKNYGEVLTNIGGIGVSAMMHGYMAFDENGKLLVPFRTWRNTTTAQAAEELSQLLGANIPQRWSIAHLYQAVLNGEAHVAQIDHINTLAGYIHSLLTGRREVGVGEASGMFPTEGIGYRKDLLEKAQKRFGEKGFYKDLEKILPAVRAAGEKGAFLTEEGAGTLDESGNLKAGIPVCPPEGDAGTGMVATNSVLPGTGNISAGTSVFAMLTLDRPLKNYYPEIDMVATPDGSPSAMVHCNNCCGELDSWVRLFGEFAKLSGSPLEDAQLYEILYKNAGSSPADVGRLAAYNYISGEPVTGAEKGAPMYFRSGDSPMTLGSFFRAQLYSSVASLKIGMDILFEKENVKAESFTCHGGLFKVKGVAQQILADALCTKTSVMETAGEGGAWGMALLAGAMLWGNGMSLPEYLDKKVFAGMMKVSLLPDERGVEGFGKFIEVYKSGLAAQLAASSAIWRNI